MDASWPGWRRRGPASGRPPWCRGRNPGPRCEWPSVVTTAIRESLHRRAVLGSGSRVHDAMHVIEDWHRWLGSRDVGRPYTGACNLAFLGLAISGLYLWWPRRWTRHVLRGSTLLRREPARAGPRLELAQRHRLLVRAGAHRPDGHRRRHVLPVGERPALPAHRQRAAAGPGGAPGGGQAAGAASGGRAFRGAARDGSGRARARARAPDPTASRPAVSALWARAEAAGARLDEHLPATAAATGRPCHGIHPGAGAARAGPDPPLAPHPRSLHRRGREVGALRRRQRRAEAPHVVSLSPHGRGLRAREGRSSWVWRRRAARCSCGPDCRWRGGASSPGTAAGRPPAGPARQGPGAPVKDQASTTSAHEPMDARASPRRGGDSR